MYVPTAFELQDFEEIVALLRQHSFATLATSGPGGLQATHLPIVIRQLKPLVIAGHVAKANPHWKEFDGETEAMVVFLGPHTYISPRWYVTKGAVPTWNYTAVHLYGRPRAILNPDEVIEHLQALADAFDPELRQELPDSVSDSTVRSMLGGLVAFDMVVDRIEAKAKLNQNRPLPDRLSVISHLDSSGDEEHRRVSLYMKRLSVPKT